MGKKKKPELINTLRRIFMNWGQKKNGEHGVCREQELEREYSPEILKKKINIGTEPLAIKNNLRSLSSILFHHLVY